MSGDCKVKWVSGENQGGRGTRQGEIFKKAIMTIRERGGVRKRDFDEAYQEKVLYLA